MPGRPFPKGKSGNPGGRPRGLARTIRELVGPDGRRVAEIAWDIAQGLKAAPAGVDSSGWSHPGYQARLEALKFLRDTAWGKPVQSVEFTGKDGGPIRFAPKSLEGLSDAELDVLERALTRAGGEAEESGEEDGEPAVPGSGEGGEGPPDSH